MPNTKDFWWGVGLTLAVFTIAIMAVIENPYLMGYLIGTMLQASLGG